MGYLVLGGKDGGVGMAVVGLLKEMGHTVFATDAKVDVRSAAIIDEVAISLTKMEPKLEGVVYCAGVNNLSWLGQMGRIGLQEAANMFAINSLGFLSVMDSFVRHYDHPLSIVAISSDAAERPLRTSSAYCASKAALNMLVRVAARELGPKGWRVNAVAPGMLEGTGMSNNMDTQIPSVRGWSLKEAMEYEKSQEVVPGRIPPREVAEVVFDLLTGPKHMNGEIVTLNGGR
ncbi:oxidoreductase [Gordonia phage NovaSharks]|uniref:Oxidoreductase n=1 Tax=Gordonia phage NovaSharks TaxID=2927258 RepID=A0A9E7Q514_9CAUD|nr:oxidoreductase [Gordonia phage NovaSharks]